MRNRLLILFSCILLLPAVDAQGCEYANSVAAQSAGFSKRCLHSQRCYLMYNPAKGDNKSKSLVIDFHGSGACGSGSAGYTGWKELADSDNLVAIFPQANSNWLPFDGPNGDVGYVRDIIASVVADASVSIDPARVYLAGHSAGCSMAQNMAVMASDIVAGVACHSLFLTSSPSKDYSPVPVIEVHGTQDFVPYDGAVSNFKQWKQLNGCQGAVATSNYDGFTQQTYQQCNGGAEVSLITVPGGGHNVYSVRSLHDTTKIAWDFLKKFTNPSKSGTAVAAPAASLGAPVAGPPVQQTTHTSGGCRDDPEGIISRNGFSCSLVIQMLATCNVDLGRRTSAVPVGMLLSDLCPASCGACPKLLAAPAAAPAAATSFTQSSAAGYRPTYFGNYGYNQYPASGYYYGYNQYPASGYYSYGAPPASVHSYPQYAGAGYSPFQG